MLAVAGGSKPDEAEAGKPELPQQEPAVSPGQKVEIPESKNEAPEPKADAANPLAGLFEGDQPHEGGSCACCGHM